MEPQKALSKGRTHAQNLGILKDEMIYGEDVVNWIWLCSVGGIQNRTILQAVGNVGVNENQMGFSVLGSWNKKEEPVF